MWGIVAVGWIVLAVLVVAAHHRIRSVAWRVPDDLRKFVVRLQRELAERHPRVRWCGLVPARLAVVLEIAGQETPVPLGPLHHHLQAFPDRFPELVDRLVADLGQEALDHPEQHEFADVAGHILPQVRSREWLRAHAPAMGDSTIVSREFGGDLMICYVIDDSWSMVFVCDRHLAAWGRSESDLFHLSTRNLQRLAGAEIVAPIAGEGPLKIRSGDGYDAARVLLLDPEQAEGKLVAVPDRDILWVADAAGLNRDESTERNRKQSGQAEHAISPKLYRLEGGELRTVSDA